MTEGDLNVLKCTLEKLQEILKGSIGDIDTLDPTTDSAVRPYHTDTYAPITPRKKDRIKTNSRSPITHGQKHRDKRYTNVTLPSSSSDVAVRDPSQVYYR